MIISGILFFSLLVIGVSFVILKKFEALEKSELSCYILFIAWGSLFFGLILAKISS
ncbi:MAG TPA: hypothetical protein VEI46_12370 [Thermodesulfovibrionales bacterium]|nr:hypothetical protein [Thermodesulfovibrionales bacterium]